MGRGCCKGTDGLVGGGNLNIVGEERAEDLVLGVGVSWAASDLTNGARVPYVMLSTVMWSECTTRRAVASSLSICCTTGGCSSGDSVRFVSTR